MLAPVNQASWHYHCVLPPHVDDAASIKSQLPRVVGAKAMASSNGGGTVIGGACEFMPKRHCETKSARTSPGCNSRNNTCVVNKQPMMSLSSPITDLCFSIASAKAALLGAVGNLPPKLCAASVY